MAVKTGYASVGALDTRDGGWDGSGITRHRIAILPGETHYTIFLSDALVRIEQAFLDGSAA